jgi:hypothetical protein
LFVHGSLHTNILRVTIHLSSYSFCKRYEASHATLLHTFKDCPNSITI